MADVAGTLRQWSGTAGSNNPTQATTIGSGLSDNLQTIQAVTRKYLASYGSNIASAATTDLATMDGYVATVTGNTTITGLGTEAAGISYWLVFASTAMVKNSASISTGADVTAATGDVMRFTSEGAGAWRMTGFFPAQGLTGTGALVRATSATLTSPTIVTGALGSSTATTQATADNSTKVATTAYVDTAVGCRLLTSGTASGATLDIVMTSYTAYAHKLLVFDLIPANDGVALIMRVSTNGGSSYDATANDYSDVLTFIDDAAGSGTQQRAAGAGATFMYVSYTANVGNGATEGVAGTLFMPNTTSTAKWPRVEVHANWISADATPRFVEAHGGGTRRAAQDTDAIRLLFDSGNIASGTWRLYGYN